MFHTRRPLNIACVVTGAGLVLALAAPARADSTSGLPKPGTYILVNDNNNQCLAFFNMVNEDDPNHFEEGLTTTKCMTKPDKMADVKWMVTNDGQIKIKGSQTHHVVCLTSSSTSNKAAAAACDGKKSQKWTLDSSGLLRLVSDNRYMAWPSRQGIDFTPWLYKGNPKAGVWGKRVIFKPPT